MDCLLKDLQRVNFFNDFTMVRRFLEIPVDEEGRENPLDENSYNYRLFNDIPAAYKGDLMSKHFNKYPVVYMNFNCENVAIGSYDEALSFCRSLIHTSFKEHKYLINSEKLLEVEKSYCDRWCDEERYYTFEEEDVRSAFKELSEFLRKHYDRKVVFLADDVNSLATEAKLYVQEIREVQKVINLTVSIIDSISTELNDNIENMFMTEIMFPGAVCIMKLLGPHGDDSDNKCDI